MAYETPNPYTGALLDSFHDATDTEVQQALENAHEVFLLWREKEVAERARLPILLKHASNVLQAAAAFEKRMREAGLPKWVFKNLYATRSQVGTIINDPRVHGVANLKAGGNSNKSSHNLSSSVF